MDDDDDDEEEEDEEEEDEDMEVSGPSRHKTRWVACMLWYMVK